MRLVSSERRSVDPVRRNRMGYGKDRDDPGRWRRGINRATSKPTFRLTRRIEYDSPCHMRPDDARKLDHKTLEEMRARAVRSVQNGQSPEAVAAALGINRTTIYDWLAKYRRGGWGALKAKPVPGRPPKLSGRAQGSPHFSGSRAIKESKRTGNLSEKNRKEPIKWAQVYDVREGVEYCLNEEDSSPYGDSAGGTVDCAQQSHRI